MAVKHRDLEADILFALQPHPNIIKVYGKCSLRPGEEALLLEYCSRGSLDTLVFPGAPGGPGARAAAAAATAAAAAAAAAAGTFTTEKCGASGGTGGASWRMGKD
ncbi:Tyrosine kinase-like (TKL) protein, putative [Eimeria tenella]|uniref:Tyrosine kinase-like (TKL) protein, putative n=1 Tax=Eimeria tenella TaxID=5802 RepID=U6KPM9_EIMTE|nr:Tyrosine kinase-like (TKL) protein, putative [Eimeria tenella]CDJ40072.1 Tyrosine kinase-like (TKL) protein, putative [Eimeria tenella]|eukprot:XP_013230825.1 Tyrosine kinase-like (TKL) protein, putative [Eimeria tenella]